MISNHVVCIDQNGLQNSDGEENRREAGATSRQRILQTLGLHRAVTFAIQTAIWPEGLVYNKLC